jgi:O-antigen/teichoic acid export membrane protein
MSDSLKSKTLHALSWTFLEAAGFQGIRFIIGIILARLLFPAQFGLIGMLIIFTTVAQSFLDSGFGSALIQKREITPLDTCSIFYFNIVVGVVAAGLLSLAAPWIAAFYKQPSLTALMRVLTLEIVINSFGLIQNVLFTKRIEFKTLTKINLIAGVLSGVLGVALAFAGFGVWSLAVQQVSSALFRTISLWIFSPWRPAWLFSFGSLRQMFGFGSRLLFSDLINRIFDNIYALVIGKLFSATDLGFFSRA